MNETRKYAIAALAAGFAGFAIGRYKWENKKTQEALNYVIEGGRLFKGFTQWMAEEGLELDHYELREKAEEKLAFIDIALNEL